uniref:Glutamate--tRNA ligase n=1 Tax=uncultured Microgenomates bacterium Rifle_16ft_4_minimus_37906 TaxID=1665116 RepID=A0A0H4T9Q1_9BACT|nr:glutamyl/glutaminyl-tRNA synthetase [uncultured Microgenomates bacterium Rifle_16ft_4_minimus_37906]
MIRTRFAPSPTGDLHIGGLRTALYSYALAKHSKGKFVLRIEDTDKKREVPEGKEKIQKILKTFGLEWDEYFVQSELAKDGRYKKAAEELVNKGQAFYCDCQPKNAKEEGFSTDLRDPCRDKSLTSGAVKLKVPENQKVSFKDFVLDKVVEWDTTTVPDTTLLKSDGLPTYHLAVVVDDHEMDISHVLRGHDWMPSTPIHLLVYKFLGYTIPEIGHLTDILDPEGGKLSKRKGSASCEGLLKDGYLPEAILNFVMLLGWAPKDDRELFTLEEFVETFDPKGFQKSNPIFNREKLDWFNGHYLRQKSDGEITKLLLEFAPKADEKLLEQITPLIKERINKLSDFDSMAGFFFEEKKADQKLFGPNCRQHLTSAMAKLESLSDWGKDKIDSALIGLIKAKGFKTGDFFMDLRIAIAGSKFTPPITDSIAILGKSETLKRLKEALK